jgi:hypothetical protein
LSELISGGELGREVSPSDKKFDLKETQENLKNAIDKALKDHITIKRSIADFKVKLAGLIAALEKLDGVQLPMVIFVDELDRCRPDYAIELLEGIKHLFGVPGVFFAIATNVQQLSESVKAIYGSGFDGQRYLKRFFDLQYALREPSNEQFSEALFNGIVLPDVENIIYGLETSRMLGGKMVVERVPRKIFALVLEKHADAFELTLRDMLQVATVLEAALLTLKDKKIHVFFLVFLAVVYQQDPIIFLKIAKAGNLTSSTGFESIDKKNGMGQIGARVINGRGELTERVIVPLEIANLYFDNMQYDVRRRRRGANADYFPDNLVEDAIGVRNGSDFKADYSKYFSLIQHAGGFAA